MQAGFSPLGHLSFLIPLFSQWKRIVWNLFLITLGSAIFAIGLNAVLIPQNFVSGGAVGVSLILFYIFPIYNPGLLYFLVNIPLIVLGWFTISRTFMIYTTVGMSVFSLVSGVVAPRFPPIEDPILAAVFAAIICGVGSGIILRSRGSAGGFDILAVALSKKWGLRVGGTLTFLNVLVLSAGAIFFHLEIILYSFIYTYAMGKVIDAVITGFNQRKSILIVSDHADEIGRQILMRFDRGCTYLKGTGGYSGIEKKIIFSIITLTELPKMKELIFDLDPSAFMVVNDTLEVLGKRHGSLKVY